MIEAAAQRCVDWFIHLWGAGFDNTAQELKFMKESTEYTSEPSLDEAADVFISFLGSVRKQGWTIDDLADAVQQKMDVNEARVWDQLSDGTYQHRVMTCEECGNDDGPHLADGRHLCSDCLESFCAT